MTDRRAMRAVPRWHLAASLLVPIVAMVLLHALGRGVLATPPLHSAEALRTWFEDHSAIVSAFVIMRLAAFVAAGYLTAATLIGVAVRVAGRPRLVRVTDLATLPSIRRLLAGITGLGMTATTAVGLAGTPVNARPAATVTLRAPARSAEAPTAQSGSADQRIDPTQPAPSPTSGTATMQIAGDDVSVPPQPAETRTTAPGDHLWRFAEERLTEAWGRAPTEAETAPYWLSVIEHNRNRLVDRHNPDLIFVGQVFELPAPPPAQR